MMLTHLRGSFLRSKLIIALNEQGTNHLDIFTFELLFVKVTEFLYERWKCHHKTNGYTPVGTN